MQSYCECTGRFNNQKQSMNPIIDLMNSESSLK